MPPSGRMWSVFGTTATKPAGRSAVPHLVCFVLGILGFAMMLSSLALEWGPGGRYVGEELFDRLLAASALEALAVVTGATYFWRRNLPHVDAIISGLAAGPLLLSGGIATRMTLDIRCERGFCGYEGDSLPTAVLFIAWTVALWALAAAYRALDDDVRARRIDLPG